MSKFQGTFEVVRAELTQKVTANSHGELIPNFWGSCKHTYEALRWSALDREHLPQEIFTTFNFDSLWEEKADNFYAQIMRIAREQGCTTAVGTRLVMSFGLKGGMPWQSKENGQPKKDKKGRDIWNSSLVLTDIEIDETASLALAQETETPANAEVAATPHSESEDWFDTSDGW